MEDIKKEVLNHVEKLSSDLYKKAWENRAENIFLEDEKIDNKNFNISDGITPICDISIMAFVVG